jgi:2-polyprenyl-3-methyl-5-hydroxy-6-metoxy-1,4-benzoquinol methylase
MADQHDNLEEFSEPELYDREYGAYEPEGPFYESLARDLGGPILDIACGTGRLSIPFAEAGLSVTGTDIMPAMLAHARAKSAHLPVRWIEADSRSLDLGETFAFAVMSGHAFQSFLTDAD